MEKTLVWEIIINLNTAERRELKLFLASPFFNQRQDVQLLYDQLNLAAKKGHPAPLRSDVFQYIYPQEKYNDQKMRLLVSYLLKLTERFLVQKEIAAKEIQQSHENEILANSVAHEAKLECCTKKFKSEIATLESRLTEAEETCVEKSKMLLL